MILVLFLIQIKLQIYIILMNYWNIQNAFETEQAIPEKDSYRFSKLHAEQADIGHSDEQSLFYVLPHKGDNVKQNRIAGRSLPATTNLPLL